MTIFNRGRVRRHRDRAAAAFDDFEFLMVETAERLADRLLDTTHRFPTALDLGCHTGILGRLLGTRGGIETLIEADLSPAMVAQAGGMARLACDEEFLPMGDRSLDLVLSNLSLHWVNDLPGALSQIRRALKPDGMFLACCLGGETLKELRSCLVDAEVEISGGLSPRVSPFADVRDLGSLLQRAGFALPVVDADEITVSYASPFKLMADLRGMGESNAVDESRSGLGHRGVLMRAAELYQERFSGPDGRMPATFQVLFMTAWAPAETQQQPARPGSANARLADALETQEVSLGEKASPNRPK